MRFKVTLRKKPVHSELVSCVGWTTADEVFSCADDHKILKTNLITDEVKEVSHLPSEVFPSDFHWAPKSAKKPGALDVFLLTSTDGKFHLVSSNGRVEKSVDAHKGAVTSGRWSHDGLALVTAGEDGTVKTWSRSGMIRSTLSQGSVPVYSVAWGPDSDQILFTSGKSLTIKSLQAHLKPMNWKAHEGIILKVDWNVTNNLIVSASEDCRYKIWDSYGRLLYTSMPHDYPVTSCAWAPDGESFAVASYNTIRLCDKKGWSYSLDKAELGSVLSLAWSSDGTQVAGACGNGQVLFCHVVGRKLEWANYEMTVTSQKTIEIYDVSSDATEHLDVRDRIIKVAFGFDHLVVASTSQCYVYSIKNWNTPLIFDLKEASVHMIVLASRQFALVDGAAIFVYSYDGRLLHQPKYNSLKTDALNSNSIALSNDTIAIKEKGEEEGMSLGAKSGPAAAHDKTDRKSQIRLFDTGTGKPLGDGKPFQHKTEVLQIALDQSGAANERRLAFVDKNYDLFLISVRQIGKSTRVEKLGAMVSGIVWNSSCNMLAAQQDGKFSVWLYPNAVYVDRDLLKITCIEKNLSEFGKNPQMLSFRGPMVNLRRADGALVSSNISPYPAILHSISSEAKWDDAVRLCRLAKDESLWACLATMASYQKNLDTAEIAYAALGLADKVGYITYIRDIPSKRAQDAELALLSGNATDAEGILIQAGLIFRAIMLNIQLYRWDRAMELAIKHKTHVDTVIGYRSKYLKTIGATEDKKLFAAFVAKGMNIDWEAIQAKINMEYARERDPNARFTQPKSASAQLLAVRPSRSGFEAPVLSDIEAAGSDTIRPASPKAEGRRSKSPEESKESKKRKTSPSSPATASESSQHVNSNKASVPVASKASTPLNVSSTSRTNSKVSSAPVQSTAAVPNNFIESAASISSNASAAVSSNVAAPLLSNASAPTTSNASAPTSSNAATPISSKATALVASVEGSEKPNPMSPSSSSARPTSPAAPPSVRITLTRPRSRPKESDVIEEYRPLPVATINEATDADSIVTDHYSTVNLDVDANDSEFRMSDELPKNEFAAIHASNTLENSITISSSPSEDRLNLAQNLSLPSNTTVRNHPSIKESKATNPPTSSKQVRSSIASTSPKSPERKSSPNQSSRNSNVSRENRAQNKKEIIPKDTKPRQKANLNKTSNQSRFVANRQAKTQK